MYKLLGWVGLAVGCASGGTCPPVGPAAPPTVIRAAIEWPLVLDHPQTPATHREAVFELLRSAGTDAVMASMVDITLAQLLTTQPMLKDYEAVMREFFGKYLTLDAMGDDFAAIYMPKFDELQLRQMVAFYRTPVGKRAVRELPLLAAEGANIGKAVVERHMDELREMVMKEFKRRNP